MIRQNKITTREFILEHVDNENSVTVERWAKIYFIDGVFDKVIFECKGGGGLEYDYDDWMFLKIVAEKVENIKKSINNLNQQF